MRFNSHGLPLYFVLINMCLGQAAPEWFWRPPRSDMYAFCAGIAPIYRADSVSFSLARQAAVGNLCREYYTRITGEMADVSSGSRAFSHNFAVEYIDSTIYQSIAQNSVGVDSLIVDGYAYYLIADNADLTEPGTGDFLKGMTFKNQLFNYSVTNMPDWVQKPPRKQGYTYGIGMAKRYHDVSNSWMESAKSARVDIANQLKVSVGSLDLLATGNRSESIRWIEEKTAAELKQSRVLERWCDKEQNLYYTLIEYKMNK